MQSVFCIDKPFYGCSSEDNVTVKVSIFATVDLLKESQNNQRTS